MGALRQLQLQGFTDLQIAREIAAQISSLGPEDKIVLYKKEIEYLCNAVPELGDFLFKASA